MAVTRISIVTPDAKEADQGALLQIANSPEGIERLGEFIRKQVDGKSKIRLNTGAVQAEGQVAFDSFVEDDTVTVNGAVFTGKDEPSGADEFDVGASDEACANNFYEKLKASAVDKIVGVIVPFRRGTVLLSSFVTTDTITINGLVFTGKTTPDASVPTEFAIGGSDAKTAENLMNAVLRCQALPAYEPYLGARLLAISRSTATLTIDMDRSMTLAASAHATLDNDMVRIRAIVGGQAGNLCTLAISAHGGVSGANLTGGTEGTETVFAQNRSIL